MKGKNLILAELGRHLRTSKMYGAFGTHTHDPYEDYLYWRRKLHG